MALELNAGNYYSEQANHDYMSVSQYKDFVGTYGMKGCEARAVSEMNGQYQEEPSQAMLIGSYVDSYFEGTLQEFKKGHPDIFRADGQLKSTFRIADKLIEKAENDKLFAAYMSGRKQEIMTAEIFGVPWKIKMDSYLPGIAVVDLKVMKSLKDVRYVRGIGQLDFVRYWGYDIQGAIYQEAVRVNTGETLPFFIAGISKEDPPDIELIHVSDVYLKEALDMVGRNIGHVLDVKYGREDAWRCGECAYCRKTKILSSPIEISDLISGI